MRRIFISHLDNWIKDKNRMPIVLRGARQVGKTTGVEILAQSSGKKLVTINLEKHRNLERVFATNQIPLILDTLRDAARYPIRTDDTNILFLDEIQSTPSALMALRYFYEDAPHLPIIAAGSLLEFTLAEHSFSMPVGRIEYFHIYPMSFEEFLLALGEDWLFEKLVNFNLGDVWSDELHLQCMNTLRQYLCIGGMPAVVRQFVSERSLPRVQRRLNNITKTYENDFAKYARQTYLSRLQTIYKRLPTHIGKKVKYVDLMPYEKSATVRECLELLVKARVIHLAYHSDANGIPLEAQRNNKVFKSYWMDVGLLNRMLNLDLAALRSDLLDTNFIHEGVLAEQFVAQHLVNISEGFDDPTLNYWVREGESGNSEVDFVAQFSNQVVPIEVKAGSTGTLKSLHQFMGTKKLRHAIRLFGSAPSLQQIEGKFASNQGIESHEYQLWSLPIYMAGQLKRLMIDI